MLLLSDTPIPYKFNVCSFETIAVFELYGCFYTYRAIAVERLFPYDFRSVIEFHALNLSFCKRSVCNLLDKAVFPMYLRILPRTTAKPRFL